MMNDLDISRGFDAGNFASAYETTDYGHAIASLSPNRSEHYQAAFTLGFFSTLELDEMGPHAEDYLVALRSPAGRRCIALGYVDLEECV